jgi:hypothetical protein
VSCCETQGFESLPQSLVPNATRLFESIDPFIHFAHHVLLPLYDEPFRLTHIYIVLEFPIEVCTLDINVTEFQVVFAGECKDEAYGGESDCGGVGLIVIETFDLWKSLRDEMCFEFVDQTEIITFHLKNPSVTNDIGIGWSLDESSCVVTHQCVVFDITCGFPVFSVVRAHGLFVAAGFIIS